MNNLKRASGLLFAALLASATVTGCSSAPVIELELGKLEILQGGKQVTAVTVKPGVEYVFRVSNVLGRDHNFWIGQKEDLAAQDYSRLTGVKLFTSGTQEIRYTFKAGDTLQFACTLASHYSPMHGDIIVEG